MKKGTRFLVVLLIGALLLSTMAIWAFASGASVTAEEYGEIPAANAGNTFVLFDGDRNFLSGTDSWASANASARAWLDSNPGKTVNVLVQKDYTVTQAVGSNDWLGHMNGTVNFDLGGHTIIGDAHILNAGTNTNYTGNFATNVIVQNGTLLNGKGLLFSAYNKTGTEKTIDYTFKNCTFGYNKASVVKGNDILFFCWKTDGNGTGVMDMDIVFKNCTLDATGYPIETYTDKTPTFIYHASDADMLVSIEFKGGEFTVGDVSRINLYRLPQATDSFKCLPNDEGSYATASVPVGLTLTKTVPTNHGTLSFDKLLKVGTDRNVYALPAPLAKDITTAYGTIPAGTESAVFAVFQNKAFLGGYNTWKDVNNAVKEATDADSTKPVQVLLLSSIQSTTSLGSAAKLSHMSGEVLYDLNGYTIIADAILFDISTASGIDIPTTTTIKVKNGTLLQGKNYVISSSNNALAESKTVTVDFDDVTFGFYTPTVPSNREILIRAQGNTNGGNLTLNMSFRGCIFDTSAFPTEGIDTANKNTEYASKTPAVFFSNTAYAKTNVKMNVSVYGGAFIVGALNKISLVNNNALPGVMFYPDENTGDYVTISVSNGFVPTWTVPTEEGTMGFTKVVTDGEVRDVYTLPILTKKPIQTQYGTIPAEYETSVFVVFQNGKFLTGTNSWNAANQAARENVTPDSAVTILLRQNATSDSVNILNRLCWMNGTVTYDLGGFTLSASKTIFEAGIDNTNYDGSCNPNIIVKNGTLLANSAHIFATENKTAYAETMTISFEGVTLGSTNTVAHSQGYLFQNWGGSGKLDLIMSFTDCTFDVRGWEAAKPGTAYNLFRKNGAVVPTVTITGGEIITDAPELLSFYTGSLLFVKDATGNYTTMSVANGTRPTQGGETDQDGNCVFIKLVTDGAQRDVYALDSFVTTKYGDIPATYANCTFAIFQNGAFVAGVDSWREVNTKVLAALAQNSAKPVEVLVRKDYTVTQTFNTSEWCGYCNGEVVYDLDGHTMIADANIFQAGINTTYSGNFTTNVTVQNGTLFNGKGLIFSVSNIPGVAKTINFTFENCTFGFNPETVAINRDIFFFCWKTDNNGTGIMDVNVLLDGCTFDARAWPDSFNKNATFIHHQSDEDIHASFEIRGGTVFTDSLQYLQMYSVNSYDSVIFTKDSEGNYISLSVINGAKPNVWVTSDLGEADFSKLVSNGTDRDVYTLQTYEQIALDYLLYVEYQGEKLYKAPFYIPTGADYNAVYLNASEYEDMLLTEPTNSIRLSESAGLRFATSIDKALLDQLYALVAEGALDRVEFGTLIAPVDYVASELTMEAMAAAGKAYLRVAATYNHYYSYDNDDATTHFVGSIVDLYEGNVGRTFLGRGYVKIVTKVGNVILLYSDYTQAADVRTVATTLLDNASYAETLSAAHKSILEKFKAGELPPTSEEAESDRQLHGLNVLAIGDSLFYGDDLARYEQWIALLARECNWNLTNLGKGGWTMGHKDGRNHMSMSYQLLNNPNYVYGSSSFYNMGNTAGKTPEDVDLIFLEGGFNDWGQDVPLGTPTSKDEYTMLGAMNVIIQTLKEMYPNATIVLITSWHYDGSKTLNGETVYRLDYTAEGMKAVYETNYKYDDRVKLIDAGDPALTDIHMYDPAWREIYSNKPTDFCHLNAKGMEIMAEHMLPLLKETLATPKEQPEEEEESVPLPEAPYASAEDCIAANIGNRFVLTGDDKPYFMGRWFEKEYDGVTHMVTLNADSVIYFMVNGAEAVNLDFTLTTVNDVDTPYYSYSIDGSAPVRQLVTNGEISLPDTGYHIVRIITDSVTESVGKWDEERGFALKSITVSDDGEMLGVKPEDKVIFFFGDSITEGVAALEKGSKSQHNSVTGAYSWLTAEALNAVPYIVGYGASGITKPGSFNTMENAIQYYSNNRPVNDGIQPDVIVINHGHNDRSADSETFKEVLLRTIALLKELYPNAEIVYMIPFSQAKSVEIKSCVYSLYDDSVHVVETSNWVVDKTDGVHPSAGGAATVAGKLSEALIEIFGKEFFGL